MVSRVSQNLMVNAMCVAHGMPPERVSRIAAGFTSLLQLQELQGPNSDQITALCLHGNSIASLDGCSHLRCLTELNLSSNNLVSLEGLQSLSGLQVLNVASNRLKGLNGVQVQSNCRQHVTYKVPQSCDALPLHSCRPARGWRGCALHTIL